VDVKAASDEGVIVANVPDYCYDEVADHAMALILACARKVVRFCKDTSCKIWDFKSAGKIRRIRGQTLGLIGFGGIARNVGRKAKAFGLNIIAYDPYVAEEVFKQEHVERISLEGVLKRADFVSIHIPKTKETEGLIGEKQLRMMKPNSTLSIQAGWNSRRGSIKSGGARGAIEGAALTFWSASQRTSVIRFLHART